MRRGVWFVMAMLAVPVAPACAKRTETPPEVAQAYDRLLRSLDRDAPGASLGRLREFARQNSGHAISSTVDTEVAAWRTRLEPAYLRARDLVREEQFDQAEAILKDLAQLPDERPGRLARDFLAFEFPQLKATRLLMRGDTAGAAQVARDLLSKGLTEDQMATTERLLDTTSTAGMGATMTRTTALRSAARSLQVFLHGSYVEEGQYPRALTLDSPELASLRSTGAFGEVVAAIEGYSATQDTFSLILRGKDPGSRFRVTDAAIEELR